MSETTVRADDRAHVFHSWSAQGLINPLPIKQIHDRWIAPHARGAVELLARIKREVERRRPRRRSGGEAPLTPGETAEFSRQASVDVQLFRVFRVEPMIGRTLGPEDLIQESGHPVAIISHAYWQSRYGGDPRILLHGPARMADRR